MIVVMIGGKARVGKSTLAALISKKAYDLGLWPKVISMATPIREAARAAGYTKDETPEAYRKFCQEVGAAKRAEDPEYWVKEWAKCIEAELAKEEERLKEDAPFAETIILVDDCRYMNEVAAGRDWGSIEVFVHQGTREIEDEDGEWREHESEELANAIDTDDKDVFKGVFPNRLFNCGTLQELEDLVNFVVPEWIQGKFPEPLVATRLEILLAQARSI